MRSSTMILMKAGTVQVSADVDLFELTDQERVWFCALADLLKLAPTTATQQQAGDALSAAQDAAGGAGNEVQ